MHQECFLLIHSLHWNIEITEENSILSNTWNTLELWKSCEKAFDIFCKFNTLVSRHEINSPISCAIILNNSKWTSLDFHVCSIRTWKVISKRGTELYHSQWFQESDDNDGWWPEILRVESKSIFLYVWQLLIYILPLLSLGYQNFKHYQKPMKVRMHEIFCLFLSPMSCHSKNQLACS